MTLTNKIRQIHAIEHRLKQGLVMQPEEVVLMKHKDRLIAERSYFRETECIFFDITEKMQRIVDAVSATLLFLYVSISFAALVRHSGKKCFAPGKTSF